MLDKFLTDVVLVATAIVGLAIVAVLVSNKSDTGGVIKSLGDALASDIGAAVKPVSG